MMILFLFFQKFYLFYFPYKNMINILVTFLITIYYFC